MVKTKKFRLCNVHVNLKAYSLIVKFASRTLYTNRQIHRDSLENGIIRVSHNSYLIVLCQCYTSLSNCRDKIYNVKEITGFVDAPCFRTKKLNISSTKLQIS